MSNWTRAQTLQLIVLYEQNPILYNVKCADFLDRIKKNDALNSISAELKALRPEVTLDEVKAKLKTIRSQYIRERNSIAKSKKSGAGIEDVYVPKLWCFDELNFLDNFIASTPQFSNIQKPNNSSLFEKSETSLAEDDDELPGGDFDGRKKNSTFGKQISRSLQLAETMVESVRIRREQKPSPQYNLGKMVENELEGIPNDLFFDAKWKIINILHDTRRKFMLRSRSNTPPLETAVPSKISKISIANSETLQSSSYNELSNSCSTIIKSSQRTTLQNSPKISNPRQTVIIPVPNRSQFATDSTHLSQIPTVCSSSSQPESTLPRQSDKLSPIKDVQTVFEPVQSSTPIPKLNYFILKQKNLKY